MIVRRVWRALAGMLLTCTVAACSAGGVTDTAPGTVGTIPEPETTDTLAPPLSDPEPPDTTLGLPPDALFGGDPCTALTDREMAFLGRVDEGTLATIDSCVWVVGGDEQVVVQLATPDEFATPAPNGEEIAPVDGVGLGAIGVDRGATYEVYVQVENGYFSVTAPDRSAAERLAALAAPRAVP